ncbi:MAG: 6-phosphofructokinase [Anaerolineaceae bacterium]|nr:6-phosphofructokinase [Anaerolineaceae bacterium]
MKKIAILTSGGDAPGMNPCIRAVVRYGIANGLTVIGVDGGYSGLIHGDFHEMNLRDVGGIMQRGGTILQTARSEEFRTQNGQRKAIRQMSSEGIDALVVIGGDGSLQGAMKMHAQGVKVIGVPASIDNDIYGTDMAIGVDTALNTIVDAIDKIRDTASSHSRAFLVETMGRESGYLAIQAGIVTGAEMVLIPEVETDVEKLAKAMDEAYRHGKSHCIIVCAEGATPHTTELGQIIDGMDLGFTTRISILGHMQRGGKPTAFDRLLASRFGARAVEFLIAGQSGVMVGLDGNKITTTPIEDVTTLKRVVSMEVYEMANILAR